MPRLRCALTRPPRSCVRRCAGNGRTYHGEPAPCHIDFALEAAPALERILTSYPKYISVSSLPADDDEQRIDIARALAEERLVMVRTGTAEIRGRPSAGGKKKASAKAA
jgi:hypothetical protein